MVKHLEKQLEFEFMNGIRWQAHKEEMKEWSWDLLKFSGKLTLAYTAIGAAISAGVVIYENAEPIKSYISSLF